MNVDKILKQSLILALICGGLAQPAMANATAATECISNSAPAQAPVQLGWDRVGERERNWV